MFIKNLVIAGFRLAAMLAVVAGFHTGTASAQETGRVVGVVVDAGTAQPLASVQVFTEDQSIGAVSAIDGRYVLRDVPAGPVTIVAQSLGYGSKAITGVQVPADGVVELTISLEQQAVAVQGITVSADVETGSTAGLIAQRQRSAIVTDAIGADQIAMSPDGDAGSALQRVPGLSVVDGKYAYVRGLGERYSSTTLNGAPLASPVPDKKVIPLDVIPSDLLESIVTSKTYSPDKPGDYAGGLVELKTKNFPTSQIFKVNATLGMNTVSTGESGLTYSGGGTDWLGFDDGTRDLPSTIPLDQPVIFPTFTRDQLQEIGLGFGGDWGPRLRESLPAGLGLGVSYGNEFQVGGRGLGLLASVTYDNKVTRQDDIVERVLAGSADGGIADAPEVDYRGERTIQSVALGGLLNVSYEVSPTNRISLNTVFNHLMDDASRVYQGFNLDSSTDQRNYRLQFLTQTMGNVQLQGEHLLMGLGDTKIDWRAGYTRSRRYEPNTREVLYRESGEGRFLFDNFIQSGSVFHQDQDDTGWNGGLDVKMPFEMNGDAGTVSFGGAFDRKDRETFSRRFRYLPLPGGIIDSDVRELEPNDLFVPEHITPDGFEIIEATFRADNYEARERIGAAYAMFDGSVARSLRLQTGLRVERAEQFVQPFDLFGDGANPIDPAELNNTDLLPAVNLTWGLGYDMNVRFGASRTLARPQLRELAPFAFADFAGGYLVTGNPTLVRSRIQNYDTRWEWFFNPGSVIAGSVFYKRFDNPIEVIVLPSSELIKTWGNSDAADNYGIELEFRTPLEPLSSSLRNFTFNTNLTLVQSEVQTGSSVSYYIVGSGPIDLAVVDKNRSLQGQSPYVFNAGLTYATLDGRLLATGLVNSFGRRIDAVGGQATPDIYEEARWTTDVVIEYQFVSGLRAKFAASRLTGSKYEFTQGGELLRGWDAGRNFSLSFSYGSGN